MKLTNQLILDYYDFKEEYHIYLKKQYDSFKLKSHFTGFLIIKLVIEINTKNMLIRNHLMLTEEENS